jgi:hypothetical protein
VHQPHDNLVGTCCPYAVGSITKLPSSRTSLLFFSGGAVCSIDAPASLDGDREPALEADLDGVTFPFPLPELEVVFALLRPPVVSALALR